MLGDRKQEEKLVLCLFIFPSQKRGEGAKVLQTSTIYHSQSSVLLAGDMLQGGFLPQESQGDGKLGHLVIRELHPCEKVIPSQLSLNKLLKQLGMQGAKEHGDSHVLSPFTPSRDSRTHN